MSPVAHIDTVEHTNLNGKKGEELFKYSTFSGEYQMVLSRGNSRSK
jgi:hypothetical protein